MKLLITLSLMIGMATAMFAQNPAAPAGTPSPLPPGPLIKPVPSGIRWTITRKGGAKGASQEGGKAEPGASPESGETKGQEKEKEGANRFDIQIIGEKVGDVSHTVTTYGGGNRAEVWKKGGQQSTLSTGWTQPVISAAGADEAEDLDWISAANFVNVRDVLGRKCMVFQDKILPQGAAALLRYNRSIHHELSPGMKEHLKRANIAVEEASGSSQPELSADTLKENAVACIDLESRLPMALQVGKVVTTYKYEALPPAYALNLPADIAAAIQARGQQIQAVMRRPVQP